MKEKRVSLSILKTDDVVSCFHCRRSRRAVIHRAATVYTDALHDALQRDDAVGAEGLSRGEQQVCSGRQGQRTG